MGRRPSLFSGAPAMVRGLALSGLAVFALMAIAVLPSNSGVSWAAVYAKSAAKTRSATVSATFTNGKKPLKGRKVVLLFRDKSGATVKRITVTLDGRGKLAVKAPKGSATVKFMAKRGSVRIAKTFKLKAGRELKVTALLPATKNSVLPGLFPY